MNKTELVERFKNEMGYSEGEATRIVDAMTDIMIDSLSQGDKISLPGVGTLEVVDRAERKGRNPNTGEEMTIPASKNVKFSPGKRLKDAVMALDFITRSLD